MGLNFLFSQLMDHCRRLTERMFESKAVDEYMYTVCYGENRACAHVNSQGL